MGMVTRLRVRRVVDAGGGADICRPLDGVSAGQDPHIWSPLIVRYLNNGTVLDDLRQAREGFLSRTEEDEPELGGDLRASGPPRAVARRLTAEGV